MAKKNLNEKISDVFFWTCVFLIIYLIVGFLLGSSWLSKGLTIDQSYNLFKDALSITAAFLAPVAAFVLFSDWREQHYAVKKDIYFDRRFSEVIEIRYELDSAQSNAIAKFSMGFELYTKEKQVESIIKLYKVIKDFGINLELRSNDGDEFMGILKAFKNAANDMVSELLKLYTTEDSSVNEVFRMWSKVEVIYDLLANSRPTI